MIMQNRKPYSAPVNRSRDICVERNFLASITGGNLKPGEDPVPGGSWDFGDDD